MDIWEVLQATLVTIGKECLLYSLYLSPSNKVNKCGLGLLEYRLWGRLLEIVPNPIRVTKDAIWVLVTGWTQCSGYETIANRWDECSADKATLQLVFLFSSVLMERLSRHFFMINAVGKKLFRGSTWG